MFLFLKRTSFSRKTSLRMYGIVHLKVESLMERGLSYEYKNIRAFNGSVRKTENEYKWRNFRQKTQKNIKEENLSEL